MAITGPTDADIKQMQLAVVQNFETIVNQKPGEVGTCKKMVRLDCLKSEWQDWGVVYAKEPSTASQAMLFKEHQLITHLANQQYPIVKVLGPVFKVQENKERYGMIQRYIPGVFIEAKTPAPLKLLLTAALLNLPARAQEGWLVFHRKTLIEQITSALGDPGTFSAFKTRAMRLSLAFKSLIETLKSKQEKIHDLQMIISPDATLTVIDPLDVYVTTDDKSWSSLLEDEELSGLSIKQFTKDTDIWLQNAEKFCKNLSTMASAADVISQCSQMDSTLQYHSLADHKGVSRVNQLRSLAATSPNNSLTSTTTPKTAILK